MPRAKKRSHQSLITPCDSHRGRAAKPKLLRRRIKISVTKKYENIRKYSSIHEYTWITSRFIFNFNRKLVGKLVWGWSDQFLISLESFFNFEVYIGWIPWFWKVHLKVASLNFFIFRLNSTNFWELWKFSGLNLDIKNSKSLGIHFKNGPTWKNWPAGIDPR